MYSILIVEDDKVQRDILKIILENLDFHLKIYEAGNESEALEILDKAHIDLFFLDIDLGNSSGLDLAFKLRENSKYEFSWIIFLTTHRQYIAKAFKEIHCYDYILKPYNKDTILDMASRILLHINKTNIKSVERKYVNFNLKDELYIKVYIDKIIFVEVHGRSCIVHTEDRNYPIKKMSLKQILKTIDYSDIVQSHKSFIVNTNYISKIIKRDNKMYDISFENYNENVPLGYKFRDNILEKLKEHNVYENRG